MFFYYLGMGNMEDLTIAQRARKVQNSIKQTLTYYGASKQKVKFMMPIIENTAWMKVKLDDARELIEDSEIVIEYDNGGGQKGIRENPLFKAYEALWKAYVSGMAQIINILPEEKVQEVEKVVEKPKTVLELVRDKHKREA